MALSKNGESNLTPLLGGIRLVTGSFKRLGENYQYWSSIEDRKVSGEKAILINF